MQCKPIIPLIKYTRPSSYDFEPYLTQWIFTEDLHTEIYVQMNEDEQHPQWIRVGSILETAFQGFLQRQEFIDEILRLYRYKQEDPLAKITEIIKEQRR